MKKLIYPVVGIITLFIFCKKEQLTQPVWQKGEWCEYRVNSQIMGLYSMRYAVVGKENDMYWFEMIGTKDTSRFIYKMLIPYGFRGKAKRIIIKLNNQQAVEIVNDPEGEPPGENRPFLVNTKVIKNAKKERIVTPAGEFECFHVKTTSPKGIPVELWLSSEVPLFRIVKFKTRYETGELTGWGIGAETQIKEKPRIFDVSKLK